METILYIYLSSFVVQIGFFILVFSRLSFYKFNNNLSDNQEPVSVIICARDEGNNLQKNLSSILTQEYRNFEVIVINDASTDNTEQTLKDFAKTYDNFRYLNINEKQGEGKKFALSKGISEAKNDILLLTDADCKPCSKHWIKNMQSNFSEGKEIVIGYSPYLRKQSLVNLLIRFDAFYSALQYLSLALSKVPYMGVGRNLAYRKSLFLNNNGFKSHQNIISGDDDLFVNESATSYNTTIEIRKESFTWSDPKTSFKDWFKQKQRHTTTARHYHIYHKTILGLLHLSHFLFYYSFFLLLSFSFIKLKFIIAIFLIRLAIQLVIFKIPLKRLEENTSLMVFSPLLDFLYLSSNILLLFSNLLHKQRTWK